MRCTDRTILFAALAENLAARIFAGNEAGIAVPPTDSVSLLATAGRLLDDPEEHARLGATITNTL